MKRMALIASLCLTTTSWAQGEHRKGEETDANGKRQRDGSAGA